MSRNLDRELEVPVRGEIGTSIVADALRLPERNRAMLARGVAMDDRGEQTKADADASYGAPEPASSPPERTLSADLVDTVTHHIIPRLLLATHGTTRRPERGGDARSLPTHEEISTLALLAAAQDVRGATAQVEARLREGMSLESILLDFIAPAARLLGVFWEDDDKTFAEVTLGLGTLHRLLATLRHRFASPPAHRGLVVLAPAPGEQHTLAIHVLGDLLSQAGWDAVVDPRMREDHLVAMVASEPTVMVGISVSCSHLIEPLGQLVARIRAASINRDLVVMLGGAPEVSGYAETIGALHCPSARAALSWLERQGRVSV